MQYNKKSRNWDGGGQERDTAMQSVRDIFPSAKITPKCVDKYPVRVMIDAKVGNGATNVRVWEGDQKTLFKKYAAKRKKSQFQIKTNLEMLKEDLE